VLELYVYLAPRSKPKAQHSMMCFVAITESTLLPYGNAALVDAAGVYFLYSLEIALIPSLSDITRSVLLRRAHPLPALEQRPFAPRPPRPSGSPTIDMFANKPQQSH